MSAIKKSNIFFLALMGFVAFVTFRFPDLDIKLLGIGRHRNFLFHSAIFPSVALWLVYRIKPKELVRFVLLGIVAGFSVGVGVHLFTDIFQSAPIKFPFIGSLVNGTSVDDRLWIGINMIICGTIPPRILRREKLEME